MTSTTSATTSATPSASGSIGKAVITRLLKEHPHSAAVLKAFVPLLEAQNRLAEELPAAVPPALDRAAFSLGKAWMPALEIDTAGLVPVFFDEAFLAAAPKEITAAAAKGFPALKDGIRALGKLLAKDPQVCRALAVFSLKSQPARLKAWAKKLELHPDAAALLSMHLAAAAARRVARAAAGLVLPAWNKGYCPVCGGRPHGSCLKGKEGQRFLQCGLCRAEWRFSRTACPVCEQDSPKELPVFFLEGRSIERAEACEACKRYLLGVDMRGLSGDTPLECFLLCMMPLDLLMQEKGYLPAVGAE